MLHVRIALRRRLMTSLVALFCFSAEAATPNVNIAKLLEDAKPGTTVTLPAGVFQASVVLPKGVSLRGAGYDKTILETGGAEAGISVKGDGSRIEDLAIRTQGSTGIAVEKVSDVMIHRVVVRGGAVGIRLENVGQGRIENTIVTGSMTGILLNRVQSTAVVNCTLVGNNSLGMSLLDATATAVFNNMVVNAGTALTVGGAREKLTVDHNLYVALFVGKMQGQPNRLMLGPWRDVSGGLDANSVQLPVDFADADKDNYRPISRLDWAPQQGTTSDWGVAELAGFRAPETDIDGFARAGATDLGVYEVPPLEGVKAEGRFTIQADDGTKSAGLFASDGRLIRYLFHDLPLKKGEYGYVLPTRTQLGGQIAAGDVQLRVVESNLRWKYRGITANSGIAGSNATTDVHHTSYVGFAPDASLLLGIGWNERGENLRCFDVATRKPRWAFRGQAAMNGLCIGKDKNIYCLREAGGGQYTLVRIDSERGQPLPWADGRASVMIAAKDSPLDGMAELNGILFIASPKTNRVLFSTVEKAVFDKSFEIKNPSCPAADPQGKLLWIISNRENLVAVDASGQIRAQFSGVAKPIGLAVRGNRLAVASAATGKIHFFDTTDPGALKPLRTIGRGDGPYGPILADRFYFQEHPYNWTYNLSLALDDDGRLAVKDYLSRVVVFDPAGKPIYESFAQFGNWPVLASFQDDKEARFFDSGGDLSWFIDTKAVDSPTPWKTDKATWRPDSHWGWPHGKRSDAVGFFSDSGKQFGIFQYQIEDRSGVLFVRFENCVGRPVLFYCQEQIAFPAGSAEKRNLWVVKRDTNRDGAIDSKDAPGTPVLDTLGKPIPWHMPARFLFALADGSLVSPIGSSNPDGLGHIWRRKGLDGEGAPVYEFGPDSQIHVKERIVPSAYDYSKTEDLGRLGEAALAPNGDYLATFQFGKSPNGMGLSNSGSVDVARFNRAGDMLWLHPMNDFGPIQGIKPSERFLLTSWGHQTEWMGLDPNGLGLGHLGFPAEVDWDGYWVDHPTQYKMFTGMEGRLHVLVGDYMKNCQHLLSLENYDNYRSAAYPVQITPAKARELAFRPATTVRLRPKPAQPRITIRKLNAPLPIDGKLEKWRAAGITPQVVMTPVSGVGISSPKDASGVIRLAYHNQDLYVQILRFDDLVSFHQPSTKSHVQDTMETCFNGFLEGFQFSVSRFTDTGPTIIRRRFFFGNLEDRTPAEHAPRSVEVLSNAKDVPERKLIESIYGEDMADCKVIVTEFKLPIDKITYKGAEESIFPVRSGSGFWIGFMIDDNDVPGSDTQKMIVWPATYNTFAVKEEGAYAVFE